MRSEAFQVKDVSQVLGKTSAIMYEDLVAAELFITMFYVLYSQRDAVLNYSNGGHNHPLLYRASPALGLFPDTFFDPGTVNLTNGDILVLYTDGVTEAKDLAGQQFSEDRLSAIVSDNSGLPAGELLDEIYQGVYRHSQGVTQNDDITLVVMKITDVLS